MTDIIDKPESLTINLKDLQINVRQQVKMLLDGSLVDRRKNLLAFGYSGSGKMHLLCGNGDSEDKRKKNC